MRWKKENQRLHLRKCLSVIPVISPLEQVDIGKNMGLSLRGNSATMPSLPTKILLGAGDLTFSDRLRQPDNLLMHGVV